MASSLNGWDTATADAWWKQRQKSLLRADPVLFVIRGMTRLIERNGWAWAEARIQELVTQGEDGHPDWGTALAWALALDATMKQHVFEELYDGPDGREGMAEPAMLLAMRMHVEGKIALQRRERRRREIAAAKALKETT